MIVIRAVITPFNNCTAIDMSMILDIRRFRSFFIAVIRVSRSFVVEYSKTLGNVIKTHFLYVLKHLSSEQRTSLIITIVSTWNYWPLLLETIKSSVTAWIRQETYDVSSPMMNRCAAF